jgi:ankyrin repeat protein
LKDQINPKDVDYDGRSPLHLAVYNNRLEVVKFLVEDANVNIDINAMVLISLSTFYFMDYFYLLGSLWNESIRRRV